jgi:predicted transglutaminase-like cysteine proteinase
LQALLAEPRTPPAPEAFGYPGVEVDAATPDRRWADLLARPAGALPGAWGELAGRLKGGPVAAAAEAVNSFVNGHVALATDAEIYEADDYWASLDETIAAGRGDCEDFAIAKMQLLQTAGVASADLYLMLVRDTGRDLDHAILLVRDGERMLVLDSASERVLPAGEVRRYRPLMAFNGTARWLFRPDLLDVATTDGASPAAP